MITAEIIQSDPSLAGVFSSEEIVALSGGEKPVDADNQTDTAGDDEVREEDIEADAEEEVDAEEEAEDGEEEDSEDDLLEAAPQKKGPPKTVPYQQFSKTVAQKNQLKREIDILNARLAEKERYTEIQQQVLRDKFGVGKEPDAPTMDEEPLDEVTHRKATKVEKEVQELKDQLRFKQIEDAVRIEETAHVQQNPDYGTALQYVTAGVANELLMMAEVQGTPMTQTEAIKQAQRSLDQFRLQRKGQGLPVAQYLHREAVKYGYAPATPKKATQKTGIDMEALDRARREAGRAPKASAGGGMGSGVSTDELIAQELNKKFG